MDERLNYIEKFFEKVCSNYSEVNFRCEFNPLSSTYIVEVTPSSFYDRKEYAEMEYTFSSIFELKFPGYMVMFVSEESLTKVTNPILEIGHHSLVGLDF